MCIHERTGTTKFQKLHRALNDRFGLVALTLVGYNADKRIELHFSMFVNPHSRVCVQRAAHDLRTWHQRGPRLDINGFSDQSAQRLAIRGIWCGSDINALPMIEGRNVPDSLDLEEDDVDSVYNRCLENGYVREDYGIGSVHPTEVPQVLAEVAEPGTGPEGQRNEDVEVTP